MESKLEFKTGPRGNDPDGAEQILDTIQAACRLTGATLIHKPDCMVLAVPMPGSKKWKAIAQVRAIGPKGFDWRPCHMSFEMPVTPQ